MRETKGYIEKTVVPGQILLLPLKNLIVIDTQ